MLIGVCPMLYKSSNYSATTLLVGALLTWTTSVMPLKGETGAVQTAIRNLDENFASVEVKVAAGIVAGVLKLDKRVVEKAMVVKGYKSSEMVLANTLAQKTGQPIETVLLEPAGRDWLADCKQHGLRDNETVKNLDDAYTETSFRLLDVPEKKKTKRLTKF